MAMGGLGTLAAVRHAMDGWAPPESAEAADDRRGSLQSHLRSNLDAARRVETHRTSTLPDVVVDGTVGVLLVEEVSERTTDRIEHRLDRFDGTYPLLFVVGLDIQNWAVWDRLRNEYETSDPTIDRTEFVFESPASLRASGPDWGNWRDGPSLRQVLVPSRRTVASHVLAVAVVLAADLAVRHGTTSRPVLPADPTVRVIVGGVSVLLASLGYRIRQSHRWLGQEREP